MLVMICMHQFVVLTELLMVMIAMLKMQVSQNGLKVNVTKYVSIQFLIKPHIRGVFCLWDDG